MRGQPGFRQVPARACARETRVFPSLCRNQPALDLGLRKPTHSPGRGLAVSFKQALSTGPGGSGNKGPFAWASGDVWIEMHSRPGGVVGHAAVVMYI